MSVEAQGIVAREPKAAVRPEPLTVDDPGPGEVLVRVQASGVCHTDYHIKEGNIAPNELLPSLLGHECAGTIEAVGAGVDYPAVGDYVIVAWRSPCGRCRSCLRGVPHLCFNGLNAQHRQHTRDGVTPIPALGIGSFSSHIVVHSKQCVTVRRDVPPECACLIGCGVMTGVGAALYTAQVRPGSTVAVYGCGGVGTSVMQGARLARARQIIGVDIDPRKLEWAKTYGATHLVNAREGDPVQQIRDLTGGLGADYVFEAVGQAQTLLQALESRDLAGVVVLIGVPGAGTTMELPLPEFFSRGGSLRVSWYGDCLPSRDFPMLCDWYKTGELLLDELVSEKIPLSQAEHAFHRMERGETLRSVITEF